MLSMRYGLSLLSERRQACRRPSFVRPKEAKASPGLKKNLIAYAADARWDELKPCARPPRQGNSPSIIGLWWLSQVEAILAPADFSKGRLAK